MLYPVLPVYLKSIGYSVIFIGILEGFSEAIAGWSKGFFGKLSDNSGKRIQFVRIGYALSALSKAFLATFLQPLWVLSLRAMDKLGKGIRTGARDALLVEESSLHNRATIFGFHRSMDTFGAVIGPTFALCYLYYYPGQYNNIFYWTLIPGLLAIGITFLLREKNSLKKTVNSGSNLIWYWTNSSLAYKKFSIGFLFFTLINSSDVFLLLKIKESGTDDLFIILMYIFYNVVYAIFSFPIGILADKIGLKKILILGILFFSLAYFGFSICHTKSSFVFLFFIYGIYAAATEGISKAWISKLVDKEHIGNAMGTFSGMQSICALFASSLTGLIWYQFGASSALIVSAISALLVIAYFIRFLGDEMPIFKIGE